VELRQELALRVRKEIASMRHILRKIVEGLRQSRECFDAGGASGGR
jgi:hypothetical protein